MDTEAKRFQFVVTVYMAQIVWPFFEVYALIGVPQVCNDLSVSGALLCTQEDYRFPLIPLALLVLFHLGRFEIDVFHTPASLKSFSNVSD